MPPAGRLADIGSGHGCFPPSPTIQGSGDVFVNNRPALRKGDALLPHLCGQCPPHPRAMSQGSATVNINNKPASRKGDGINCGGSVSTGSADVIIGDDSYGSGTGEVLPTARFVLSQIPGDTSFGYHKEPYKLFHNGGLVQQGVTSEEGVIEFELDELKGTFEIEALHKTWKYEVRAFAPADSDAGIQDRLVALGYHVSNDAVSPIEGSAPRELDEGLAWFQASRDEDIEIDVSETVRSLLRGMMP